MPALAEAAGSLRVAFVVLDALVALIVRRRATEPTLLVPLLLLGRALAAAPAGLLGQARDVVAVVGLPGAGLVGAGRLLARGLADLLAAAWLLVRRPVVGGPSVLLPRRARHATLGALDPALCLALLLPDRPVARDGAPGLPAELFADDGATPPLGPLLVRPVVPVAGRLDLLASARPLVAALHPAARPGTTLHPAALLALDVPGTALDLAVSTDLVVLLGFGGVVALLAATALVVPGGLVAALAVLLLVLPVAALLVPGLA